MKLVSVSWRRWRSSERRHRKGPDDFAARVELEGLAKGLSASIEPDQRLVGPLITDARHLARTVGDVFTAAGDQPMEG
jgi:hypothetical protein